MKILKNIVSRLAKVWDVYLGPIVGLENQLVWFSLPGLQEISTSGAWIDWKDFWHLSSCCCCFFGVSFFYERGKVFIEWKRNPAEIKKKNCWNRCRKQRHFSQNFKILMTWENLSLPLENSKAHDNLSHDRFT